MVPYTASTNLVPAQLLIIGAAVLGILRGVEVIPAWTLALSVVLLAAGLFLFFRGRRDAAR
jgi:hypothetical protein